MYSGFQGTYKLYIIGGIPFKAGPLERGLTVSPKHVVRPTSAVTLYYGDVILVTS